MYSTCIWFAISNFSLFWFLSKINWNFSEKGNEMDSGIFKGSIKKNHSIFYLTHRPLISVENWQLYDIYHLTITIIISLFRFCFVFESFFLFSPKIIHFFNLLRIRILSKITRTNLSHMFNTWWKISQWTFN